VPGVPVCVMSVMLNVFASASCELQVETLKSRYAFDLDFGTPLKAIGDGHRLAGRTEVYGIKLNLQVLEP
jgi:hypothetical protein